MFLKNDMFQLTIPGIWNALRGALPKSPRPDGRPTEAQLIQLPLPSVLVFGRALLLPPVSGPRTTGRTVRTPPPTSLHSCRRIACIATCT